MNDIIHTGAAQVGPNQTSYIIPNRPMQGEPYIGDPLQGTPWITPLQPWEQQGIGYPPPGTIIIPTPAIPDQDYIAKVMEDMARRAAAAQKDAAMLGDSGYERIEAELYQTPPENVDCLLEFFQPVADQIWEPACGEGYIAKRLMDFGWETWSSDLNDYGWGTPGRDFLKATEMPHPNSRTIITNPPYIDGMAEEFVRHALKLTEPVKGQVAMFLRNEFDCGKSRMDLFSKPPFHAKIVVTKRPRWIAGSTGSPRHNYAWFVWDWRHVRGPGATYYQHPSFAKPLRAYE